MRRSLIAIIALILIALLGMGIYLFLSDRSDSQSADASDLTAEDASSYFTPSMLSIAPLKEPAGDRIDIQTSSGIVTVRNFYGDAIEKTPEYIAVTSTASYDIVYFPEQSSFLITVNALPVQENRLAGEAALVALLDVTPAAACRLSVSTGIPSSVDPESSGTNYGLSFCHASALAP